MTRKLLTIPALALALVMFAACEDEDLNQFGAAGAHETTLNITANDHWFAVAGFEDGGSARTPPSVSIRPHHDVTFSVTNAGSGVHSFSLYADEAGQDLLVTTGPIPAGESATVTFHFHDVQVTYFRDDDHAEMKGELHVSE